MVCLMFISHRDSEDGDIPPDSEIAYTLELLNVKEGPNISNLTDQQRLEFGYYTHFITIIMVPSLWNFDHSMIY